MSYFTDFVRGFLDLGATVILPVVIFLLGLFFRQKIGAAFRSGLTIGVAFVGIFLVIDLLVKNLGPAAQAMVKNLGVSLNVIDVGWPAPMMSEFFDLPGVSIATGSTISYAPGIYLVKLLQKVPGLNKLDADPETIQKRFGAFGESIFVGLILGLGIGVLAGYKPGDIINLGMSMAAVMVLMPRMVKILMEGLMPVSESARTWLNKRFGEREIYIGLDAAVALGHPAVISTALILVPITVLLAVILPGNQVLPFGDLATIPFVVAFIVGAARGNIIHSVIVGTIMIAISLYIATDVAPIFTDMAKGTNVQMPKGSSEISSIDQGGNIVNYLIFKLFSLFN
ncbi:TPA: PTS galactitol transporter subunit IIC [Staphylococcus aureus]|nr:PTS galactitol transporter subunit IIC [Staphylococcus aureus]